MPTEYDSSKGVGGECAERFANLSCSCSVDWAAFLGRHDLVWQRLPDLWTQGAFVGNGRLGAMIYRGCGEADPPADVLGWTIGRSDVYDNRDRDYQASEWSIFDHYRLPIGRFELCPVGQSAGGTMRLDLWNAHACGVIGSDRGEIRWRSWVQSGDAAQIVAIELDADPGQRDATLQWRPSRAICPRMHKAPEPGYVPNPDGRLETRGETHVWIQPLLVGGDYATAWREVSLGPAKRILYVAVGYALFAGGAAAEACAAVDRAAAAGPDALQRTHRTWWHEFYPRSFLSVPDGRIESHYWIQLYKLASATRRGGVIVDTCGPWLTCDTPWPATWWNLNVQLLHYPIPVANQSSLSEPLFDLLRQELANGHLIDNAPPEMRHDSAYFGNPTTTSEMINRDVYWEGVNVDGGPSRRGARLNQLPWICHTWWEHYRREMDDRVLRGGLFELTRRAYSFIFHFLIEGDDGRLHVKEIYSSEYGGADDANEALAMIRWGCRALLWMCDRLGIDDADIPRWRDILARLAPPPCDETGLRIGSDVALAVSHRHYAHLMELVPFRTWDFNGRAARELALRSINHWLSLSEALAGYSYTGGSSMFAALGDGAAALRCLREFLARFDNPNTMYVEWGPVMETPPSAARCVQDMLLQSHDVIRIFPAVPPQWADAAFHDLLAEGAFLVSAVRSGGQTRFVRIKSLAGEPCRVKTDLVKPTLQTPAGPTPIAPAADGVITLDLPKGAEAVLTAADYAGPLTIHPLPLPPQECNYYGLKC
ncbi:MAG: glycoside hydrolase family 95-like protein [Planctomycetaceae bacterium]|nr:hypothetical protein [Planctomycetaceae bacterium]